MFAYPIIVAAMIGSGLLIGWIDFSYLWGMIQIGNSRIIHILPGAYAEATTASSGACS